MVRPQTRARVVILGIAAMLVVGACGASTASNTPGASTGASAPAGSAGASASSAAGTPQKGGTIYVLTQNEQWNQIDPQRAYTGEDLAFFNGTIYRSLTAFKFSKDFKEAGTLVGDLATDTGTQSDGGKTWAFTLRDGVSFQDASPITCADLKYAVSRTFATTIINQGPTYILQYLDIPRVDGFIKDKDGKAQASNKSAYGGPYSADLELYTDNTLKTKVKNDTAAFDKAIDCSADGKTITFHLGVPVGDFNYSTTLGMFPVPKAADTGATYGVNAPYAVSSGPYQIESYTPGKGGKFVLVRNPNWKQESDPYRHAYPDKWEVDFGLQADVIDQRLLQSSGADATAIEYGSLQPSNLAVVFKDATTPNDQYATRAVSELDIYSRYLWINVQKVKNPKMRQAMAVALDRDGMRKNAGGEFYGDYADGVIKPNLGVDYSETGLWTTFFGQKVPEAGDPELAKKLITESGEPAPALTYDFPNTPVRAKEAVVIGDSLTRAGFKVTLNPIEAGKYYSVAFDPTASHEFGYGGWGYDWPNGSTVIPPLFTQAGGWDLSQLDDKAFNDKVKAALGETDRAKQATLWQALNKEAAENMYVIPTFFGKTQRIGGTNVGPQYLWGPYSSWAYGDMYVIP